MAGLSYRDVDLVNNGLDRLGDSLLKNRMLEQQRQERAASQRTADDRTQIDREQLGFQKERATAEQAHWGKIEEAAKLQSKFKELAAYQKDLQNSFSVLGEQVRAGALTSEEASQYVLESVNAMPEEMRGQFTNNPQFKAISDGKVDWSKVGMATTAAGKGTAATQNAKRLGELRSAVVEAQAGGDQDEIAQANQELLDFQTLVKSQDIEQVTETPGKDENMKPIVNKRVQYKQPRGAGAAASPAAGTKKLTLEQAQQFLKQAGGDKEKARELARKAGYSF